MVSPAKCISGRSVADWIAAYPVVSDLCALKETAWVNPDKLPFAQAAAACPLTLADIENAAARLERFAPYLAAVFPETAAAGGIIESPVQPIPRMQKVLEERSGTHIAGQVWIKLDSHLPISGSIKARGGIYEVLKTAEDIALHSGMLHLADNYAVLAAERQRRGAEQRILRRKFERYPRKAAVFARSGRRNSVPQPHFYGVVEPPL